MKYIGSVLAALCLCGCGHPSDARLTSVFESHRSEFDQILSMVREDRGRFSVLWLNLTPHQMLPATASLPEERRQAYENLCRPLGIRVIDVDPSGPVQLTVSSLGLINAGSLKGYVYSETAPSPLLHDLDHELAPNPDPSQCEYGYHPLKQNWYLFYAHS